MKRVIVFFIFLFPLLIYPYNTIETDNCYIYFSDKVPQDVATRIAEYAEGAFRTLKALYSYNPGKVHIQIHENVDMVNAVTNIILFNKIDIYLDSPITQPSFKDSNFLKRVIIHEMTHVFDLNMTRGYSSVLKAVFGKPYLPFTTPNLFKPLWLTEGLAVFNESYFTESGRINDTYFDALLRNYSLYGFPSMDKATSYYTNPKYPFGLTPYYIGAFMIWGISKEYCKNANPTSELSRVHAGRFYYWVNYGLETFVSQLETNDKKEEEEEEISYTEFYEKIIEEEVKSQRKKINKIKSSDYTKPEPLYWSKEFSGVKNFCVYDHYLYIIVKNTREESELLLYDINSGKTWNIKEGFFADFIDIDATGKYVVFSMYKVRNSSVILNLFIYDTRRREVIDTGLERVVWASLSYLGDKMVVMRNREDGDKEIGIYYIETKTYKRLNINLHSYYPLFIDDDTISYFRKENKKYNLYMFKISTYKEELITSFDMQVFNPRFNDGKIVFASDKSGVCNVYSFDISNKTLVALTNIITLADKPFLTNDRLYFITLGVNGATISYSTLKEYKPPKLDLERIKPSPYSPVKLKGEVKKYNPFSHLNVYWWLPYFTIYHNKNTKNYYSLGAITSWKDPLKENNIFLSASIDNKSRGEYNFRYSFVDIDVGLGFLLNSERRIKVYEVPLDPTGVGDYYQSDYNNALYFLYAYSTLISTIEFLIGGVYNYWDDEEKPNNMYYELYTGSFYGLSGGIVLNFLSYYFQNIKPTGLLFKGFVTKYLNPKVTELAINLDIDADTDFVIRHSVFSLRVESKSLWGKKFPQKYYTIGGSSVTSSMIFRGYSTDEFGGYYYILGNVEYTIPLSSIFSGYGNKAFFLKELFLNLFYDFGQVSNYGFNEMKIDDFDISTGFELGLSMFFGYSAPLNLIVGYAITYPKKNKVSYARVATSIGF